MDECCLLPSQLLIPSLDWLPVSDGLVSRLQPKQPLRLHFGKAPTLPASASALQLDGLIRCVPASAPWPLRVPCGLLLSGLDLDAGLGDVLARPVTPVPPSPSLHSVICVTSASLCMECRRAGLWLRLSPCGAQAYPAWALVHWRSVWCGCCGVTEGPVGKAPRRAGCSWGRQAAAAGACGVSPYRPAAPRGRVSFLLFRRESCTIRGHIRHFPVSDAHVMGRLA